MTSAVLLYGEKYPPCCHGYDSEFASAGTLEKIAKQAVNAPEKYPITTSPKNKQLQYVGDLI